MNLDNFFSELKRRNVYKVAVAYAVIAWLLIQAASILFPTFEAPAWVMKVFVVIVAAGFVVALLIAWAFEMTPQGIKRTEDVRPDEVIPQWSGRKFAALIIVIAIGAAGLLAYQWLRPKSSASAVDAPGIPLKSIAVLPFESLSEEKGNAYFAEGIQDEIITRLAKVADLKVISRTSTQRFKSTPSDLREIARQLGVMNILEGSVQKSNDQVRVNVQLINAMTDAHLWADIYDRKLTDVFAVESDIAKTVADTLQAKLTGSEKQMMAAQPTNDMVAYELYHKGRSLWESGAATTFRKQSPSTSRRSRAIRIMRWPALVWLSPTSCSLFTRARIDGRLTQKRKKRRSKHFASIPTWPKRTSRWAKCFSLAKSIWPEPCANTNARSSSSRTTRPHIIGSVTTRSPRSVNSRRPSSKAGARSS